MLIKLKPNQTKRKKVSGKQYVCQVLLIVVQEFQVFKPDRINFSQFHQFWGFACHFRQFLQQQCENSREKSREIKGGYKKGNERNRLCTDGSQFAREIVQKKPLQCCSNNTRSQCDPSCGVLRWRVNWEHVCQVQLSREPFLWNRI